MAADNSLGRLCTLLPAPPTHTHQVFLLGCLFPQQTPATSEEWDSGIGTASIEGGGQGRGNHPIAPGAGNDRVSASSAETDKPCLCHIMSHSEVTGPMQPGLWNLLFKGSLRQ